MSILSKKFDEKVNLLKQEFELNRSISHNGVKGSFNEYELSDLISEVIPSRYKITKGIIENSAGEQSRETDIIIYDDEILPAYFKGEYSFLPVEAVRYAFEIKSSLNATELKSTIQKFDQLNSIGGKSPCVLFAYSTDVKGHELERYRLNEENNKFHVNPALTALCVVDKCYYFKSHSEHYLRDYFSNKELLEMMEKSVVEKLYEMRDVMNNLLSDEQTLSSMSRSVFALILQSYIQLLEQINTINEKNLEINGVKVQDITFKIHKWIGLDMNSKCSQNSAELSLLTGITNTLSNGNFGNYLLSDKDFKIKTYAVCYEDMWGNLSCRDFNISGLGYDVHKVNMTFSSSNDENKIIFENLDKPDSIPE